MNISWNARVRAEPSTKFTLTIPSLSSLRQQNQQQEEEKSPAGPAIVPDPDVVEDIQPIETETTEVAQSATTPRINDKAETRRINALKTDVRIDTFDAHRVLCKMCGCWVKLHNVRTHDLWNWQRHAEKCELKPGRMKPEFLQARAAANTVTVNHDYSLRLRPVEDPTPAPVEQSVSARRKVRRNRHSAEMEGTD